MVTIHVGPDKSPCFIHEDVICDRSRYFRTAFQEGYAETTIESILLEEDDTATIKLFVQWLYGGQEEGSCSRYMVGPRMMGWYGLVAFAHKIGLPELLSYAEDQGLQDISVLSFSKGTDFPAKEEIEYIFQKCSATCRFRHSVVDRALSTYLSVGFTDHKY